MPKSSLPTANTYSERRRNTFAPEGTLVGQFAVTDGSTHNYTYYIHDTADGRFALDGDRLVSASEFQLSHGPAAVTIDVLAVDENGNGIEKTFTINVTGQLALVSVQRINSTEELPTFNSSAGALQMVDEGRIKLTAVESDGSLQPSSVNATVKGATVLLDLPLPGQYGIALDLNGNGSFETQLAI